MRGKRTAIYARVACATPQTGDAILSQLEVLREYGANHGMEIIEEFTDEGYSGLRLDRPGLDRMRDLAQRRGFDLLLTVGPDRLARSSALLRVISEELERCAVTTIFLEGGAVDAAFWSRPEAIASAVAQFRRRADRYRGREVSR